MKPSDRQRDDALHEQAHLWRVRLAEPEAADEWQQAFEQWLSAHPDHTVAYSRAVTVWEALGSLEEHISEHEITSETTPVAQPDKKMGSHHTYASAKARFALAACLLVFVGWWALSLFTTNPTSATRTYTTETREIRQFILADGSHLTLGPDSRVTLRMEAERRQADLDHGEALFNVVGHDARPFVVVNDTLTVTVVGTLFEVRDSGGVSRVAVAEGRVLVAQRGLPDAAGISSTQRIELRAGQRVLAMDGGLSHPEPIASASIAAWRHDRLVYKNGTFRELIDDANRYSGRPVVLENVILDTMSDTVTASFDSKDIDSLLATLPALFPVTVDLSDPLRVVIRGKPGP
ncbi:MAG: FecR domain-containing protein [Pseudomonadota bacterium]